MRPLMYGYVRVDLAADRLAESDQRIRAFAEREGFDLGTVFREHDADRSAFSAMIHELRRAEAHHVAVPSMWHVWGPVKSRQALIARLWREAGAGIWVADDCASSAGPSSH